MKETFYFPHDFEPTSDPKMTAMIGNLGGLGYGVFWRVIEMLHSSESHRLPCKQYIYEAIAKQMLANAEQIQAMLICFAKDYELLSTDGEFFWSERVFRNFEKRESISEKRREAGKKGAIAKQNLANASKVKESKINKNKEKQIETNTPHLRSVREFEESSEEFRLSKLLMDQILIFNPRFKLPDLQRWSVEIDKMIRIDKRSVEDIEVLILWVTQDSFWKANILSTAKLREKFDQCWTKAQSMQQQKKPSYSVIS